MTPLQQFIEIQEMQFKLDKLKKDVRSKCKEIRSLSQTIPKLIRELPLQ